MTCSIVALQHLLPSLDWLRRSIPGALGAELHRLVGKPYSNIARAATSPAPDNALELDRVDCIDWSTLSPPLLILDEGGALHRAVPGRLLLHVAGVEQTTYGIQDTWRYPVSLVCRSAAKLLFESQVISRGILRKLDSLSLLDGRRIGVIGLGALGGELARRLLARDLNVAGFDIAPVFGDMAEILVSLDELLGSSDLILGCTGVNSLMEYKLTGLRGRKTFASCSSSNVEFRSLLDRFPNAGAFDNLSTQVGHCDVQLLNGGYPINFDRCREWEDPREILLTRRLCLEGLIQAKGLLNSKPRGVMLSPKRQLVIVEEWLADLPAGVDIRTPGPITERVFLNGSEGEYVMSERPSYQLHTTTPGALAHMRKHKQAYEAVVEGLPIIVLPNVWSPAYDWSSAFYVENFPLVAGRDFLEIGSGTGVISVFAAQKGAKTVTAVDVNPEAVRNTALNFDRFDVANGSVLSSDGFENVKGTYDVITWNAPYHGVRPADMLERGCSDEDYNGIRSFFTHVHEFLNPGGLVVFGFSESGDLGLIDDLIDEAGLRVQRHLSDWRRGYNCMLFQLVRKGGREINRAVDVQGKNQP